MLLSWNVEIWFPFCGLPLPSVVYRSHPWGLHLCLFLLKAVLNDFILLTKCLYMSLEEAPGHHTLPPVIHIK